MKIKYFFILLIFLLNVSVLFSSPPDWQPISGTEYVMVVYCEIFLYGNTFSGVDTCNIAGAFGPAGESDCRSIGIWEDANPPHYNGFWYFTVVGNDNCETISFKIYNSNNDSVYSCNETINFEDGTTIGDPVNPYNLTVGQISINCLNGKMLGVSTYPNPFRHTINFDLSQIQKRVENLSIYDIKGCLIRKFTYNDLNNSNILNWKGTDLKGTSIPAGIYFYKLETASLNSVGKILYFH